jgi:hypothetical protein
MKLKYLLANNTKKLRILRKRKAELIELILVKCVPLKKNKRFHHELRKINDKTKKLLIRRNRR